MIARQCKSDATRRRSPSAELRNRRRIQALLRRLAQLVALLWLASCSDQAVERPRAQLGDFLQFEAPPVPELSTFVERSGPEVGESDDSHTPARDDEVPYVCERFELRVLDNGRTWHKRLRHDWTDDDRDRFRKLVVMVARELGADPRLLTLWALRESTYNPYAIHVLDPDVEGSTTTWRRHRWDPERAAELEAVMAELGARDPGYWTAKAELARISRFRDNPHYDTLIEYEVVLTDGTRTPDRRSAWSYGYGPFGFNPTYFLPTWDASAPPWVFCNDDGLAAIVTAVWAAREHQRECESLGFGASNEVVNRRFSSGHCKERPAWAKKFRKRARARGIDPNARAKLGDRWPAEQSDRAELLAHLRKKAVEQGLLSNTAN